MTKKEEMDLILKIVDRKYSEIYTYGLYKSKLDMIMDIEAAHADCPLDLQKLLDEN